MQPLLQIEATFNSVKSTPTRLYEWRKCFAEFYDVDGRMRQIDRAHLVDIISLLGPNPIFEKKAGQLKKFLKEDA